MYVGKHTPAPWLAKTKHHLRSRDVLERFKIFCAQLQYRGKILNSQEICIWWLGLEGRWMRARRIVCDAGP